MEWWGIRVQWNGGLIGDEILRRGWGVVMSWWGGRVSGGGMLGGEFCFLFLFLGSFLNSCGCSAKSNTSSHETFFPRLNGTEHGSQPSLTTRDRELVSVLEVLIEPGDLNPRPLTPQSVTLPTIPRAGYSPLPPCYFCMHFLDS